MSTKPKPKTVCSQNHETMHFSVGAIIKKDNKFLIIDRNLQPVGYAGVAGHIDEKETPLQALKREIKEEVNLDLISQRLLFKKNIFQNEYCVYKAKRHKWYVYECKVRGELKPNEKEVKSVSFLLPDKIKKLYKAKKLEYAWGLIFKKLKII